ncbi:MAG: glycosyltransferase N-terminal domain-containing protein [Thermodesulfobacteriota bacterium]
MILLYQLLGSLGLLLLAPVLAMVVLARPQYRQRFLARLGWGLAGLLSRAAAGRPRIWIHALSVGEVTSVAPLVRGFRELRPEVAIVFSTTTASGAAAAGRLLAGVADAIIPFPFDLGPVVRRYFRLVQPGLVVVVETDLWPRFLHEILRRRLPAVLVNGRLSEAGWRRYRRLRPLLAPLLAAFRVVAVQSGQDGQRFRDLGAPADRVVALGNLKYEAGSPAAPGGAALRRADLGLATGVFLLVAGSTHAGEEGPLLDALRDLTPRFPGLRLAIAPRRIERGPEVAALATGQGWRCGRRQGPCPDDPQVFVLDTLGELVALYALADAAFIGGSLVAVRGHNPLEAARLGKPVLFGPHMEDFAEIAADLEAAGAAFRVADSRELARRLAQLLADAGLRQAMAGAGLRLVAAHAGVTRRHLELLSGLWP